MTVTKVVHCIWSNDFGNEIRLDRETDGQVIISIRQNNESLTITLPRSDVESFLDDLADFVEESSSRR